MHYRTPAELNQISSGARQLRAETLGGVTWIVVALTGIIVLLRQALRLRRGGAARQA